MSFTPKSEFIHVLSERGHLNQCTDIEGLDAYATKNIITGYVGYDATAKSFHVGNLAAIMMLHRLQQTGHRPLALLGGGTTKIGDPSDKTGLRQMRTDEEINGNIASLKTIFDNYLHFGDGPQDATLVNNADWLDHLEYIPFLRDVGQYFTINRMVTFDFVKRRLEQEQPLTFLEFNYMIMQGFDFVELNKRYGCVLQMGGSDQWGNIVNGVELGHKKSSLNLFGLTTNLITNASGAKMGKTVNGAVWMKADMLSPYDYWQFWRNTEDADVTSFMKLFTDLPMNEIAKYEKLGGAEINDAKKVLAHEATKLCHGEKAALQAAETARATFEAGGLGGDLPIYTVKAGESPLLTDVIVSLGFCASKGEAKRLIEQGGLKVNDEVVTTITTALESTTFSAEGTAKLTAGKKKHAILKKA